jgi:anti-anti-sigma regulatory factor
MEVTIMLKLNLTTAKEGQLFLSVRGRMTLENIGQIRKLFRTLNGKCRELFIDIGQVTDIDSAAVEMLVEVRAAGQVCGTAVNLLGLATTRICLLLLVKLITAYGPPTQGYNDRREARNEVPVISSVINNVRSVHPEFGDFCDNYAAFSIARHRIEKGAVEQGLAELQLLREHILRQPNEVKSVRHLLPAINEIIHVSGRAHL